MRKEPPTPSGWHVAVPHVGCYLIESTCHADGVGEAFFHAKEQSRRDYAKFLLLLFFAVSLRLCVFA
ncbi:hypothetical protein DCC62_28665 [candidate division KSB1 bacterium]|nr:MAG: hypothetical protein DCC62_28665 [candidate division KSB1 bacterium]